MQEMRPEDVSEVVAYLAKHGADDSDFDVVVAGPLDGDLAAMEEAGATWYTIGPSQAGESPVETLDWIRNGPPLS
jgi:hypothetical protein